MFIGIPMPRNAVFTHVLRRGPSTVSPFTHPLGASCLGIGIPIVNIRPSYIYNGSPYIRKDGISRLTHPCEASYPDPGHPPWRPRGCTVARWPEDLGHTTHPPDLVLVADDRKQGPATTDRSENQWTNSVGLYKWYCAANSPGSWARYSEGQW